MCRDEMQIPQPQMCNAQANVGVVDWTQAGLKDDLRSHHLAALHR